MRTGWGASKGDPYILFRINLRSLKCHQAQRTDYSYSMIFNELSWDGRHTISAVLSCQIDNNTSRLHRGEHLVDHIRQTLGYILIKLTSSVMSFGAGLPGINAVVITMSTSRHCSRKSFISASMNSFDISFAYPPPPEPSSLISTSINSAPSDWTCSRAADRVSNPRTIAPRRRA